LKVLLGLVIFVLVACSTASSPKITPLPTAIPPSGEPGGWAISFSYTFESGWGVSAHRYQFLVHCPAVMEEDLITDWVWFDVVESAQLSPDPVYMRINGLSYGVLAPASIEIIHPEQQTVAVVTLLGFPESTARTAAEDCQGLIRYDDKPPLSLTAEEPFRP
jgi:hypothetical protein